MIRVKEILLEKQVNSDLIDMGAKEKSNFSFIPVNCIHWSGSYHLNKFDMI
jgi:hypothetical protein